MYKYFFLLGVLIASKSIAQPLNVQSAVRYLDFEQFDLAKERIDQAVVHEKTIIDPKAWVTRGDVYVRIAQIKADITQKITDEKFLNYRFKDPKEGEKAATYAALSENPLTVAFDSYLKARELDAKSRFKQEVGNGLTSICNISINAGVFNYKNSFGADGQINDKESLKKAYSSYELFLQAFNKMDEVGKTLYESNLNASKLKINDIKFTMGNAAYYSGMDMSKAKMHYEELAAIKYPELVVYRNLVDIYKTSNDIEGAKKVWDNANANFADNKEMLKEIALDEAIFYQNIKETDILMKKLDQAIALDPTNASLFNVLGGLYSTMVVNSNNQKLELKDKTKLLDDAQKNIYYGKAEDLLNKAKKLDPIDASNYTQLGSMYLSEGLVFYNDNQKLGFSAADIKKSEVLSAKYKDFFTKAVAEYTKAYEMEPTNKLAIDYLSKANLWLGNTAESVKYQNILKELK